MVSLGETKILHFHYEGGGERGRESVAVRMLLPSAVGGELMAQ